MRIKEHGRVIVMGRRDTKAWEDAGPDGYCFRKNLTEIALGLSEKHGKSVEIYASAEAGGWMAEQIKYDAP